MMVNKGKKIFEDVNVLDFTWIGVGSRTTKYLAEYGAQVVRIESSVRPDPLRTLPPFKDDKPGLNRSELFCGNNISKYSMALNLNHAGSKAVLMKLLGWADVITESFTPGTLQKWDFDYDHIKEIKPEIILLSTCMHGQTGPAASHPGYGIPLTSLSGFTNITGWPDRPPCGVYGPFTDYIAPLFNVVALLSALDYRRRTGKGQHLDLSQNECAMHFLSPIILDYGVNGREFKRAGNRSSAAAPHGVYKCLGEDRWCAITVMNDEQWYGFCQAIDSPEWTKDGKFISLLNRKENEDELDALVESWTSSRTAEEIVDLLQENGVPAGIVNTGKDILNDPQINYYQHYLEREHPEMEMCLVTPNPPRLSKAQSDIRRPPLLGEHTEEVCKNFLGMNDEEYVNLLIDGVLT